MLEKLQISHHANSTLEKPSEPDSAELAAQRLKVLAKRLGKTAIGFIANTGDKFNKLRTETVGRITDPDNLFNKLRSNESRSDKFWRVTNFVGRILMRKSVNLAIGGGDARAVTGTVFDLIRPLKSDINNDLAEVGADMGTDYTRVVVEEAVDDTKELIDKADEFLPDSLEDWVEGKLNITDAKEDSRQAA